MTLSQFSPAQPPNHPTTQSPVTVRLLFPTAADNPVTGGIVPLVVEVRELVSERGVFWTERLLIGVEGQVLLDTTQLTDGEYDPATQEMVYRVLTPWWTLGMSETETFVWTQAQWVGVPLNEQNAPAYREGKTTDAVDVTIGSEGSVLVAKRVAPDAQRGTHSDPGVGASPFRQGSAQRPQRRARRAIEALRWEAQRRLAAVRRADKGKRTDKSKRGGIQVNGSLRSK